MAQRTQADDVLDTLIDQLRKLKPYILVACEMGHGFHIEQRIYPGPIVKPIRFKGFPPDDVDERLD